VFLRLPNNGFKFLMTIVLLNTNYLSNYYLRIFPSTHMGLYLIKECFIS